MAGIKLTSPPRMIMSYSERGGGSDPENKPFNLRC